MFQDGDILLCKSNDLISRLIKWGTNSIYSHVAVVASAKLGLIIEAIPLGGVRAIHIENYRTSYDVYRVKEQYVYNIADVIGYLLKMLARKYDFPSVIKLAGKMFLRKLKLVELLGLKIIQNKRAADSLQEDNDYFCSELCYKAFFSGGGLDIVPAVGDAEATSPGDIARSEIVKKV